MDDRELTRALEALGLDRTNWRAVVLLPLIEVAWADGRVQRAERELLISIARDHGIQPGDVFLERWLARRPPKATFVAARTLLLRLWSRAGQGQAPQPQTLDQLLELCRAVAEAAGGLFGLAFTVERRERDVIREIASSLALGPALPEPVRKAWAAPKPSAVRTVELPLAKIKGASGIDHEAPTARIVPPFRGREAAVRHADPAHPASSGGAGSGGSVPDDETTTKLRPFAPRPVARDPHEDEQTRPYLDEVPDSPDLADLDE